MSKRKSGGATWPYLAAGVLVIAGAAAYLHLSGGGGQLSSNGAPAAQADVASTMVAVPERPILRYAESSQPVHTALVVRGGETVQITCAAPAVVEPPALPLLREVTPTPVAAEPPALAETVAAAAPEPVIPEPATPVPAAPEPEAATTEPTVPEAPAAAEPVIPVVEPPATPEPAPEATAAAVVAPEQEAAPQPPAAPVAVIERVEPEPVPGSRQPQTLTLFGRHFTPESQVTVSWRGQRKTLAATQVRVLDSGRIVIDITTGATPATWSVAVAGADGQLSQPYPFKVVAPVKAPAAPAPAPVVAAQPAPAPQPAAVGFRDAAWLWAQNPRHFTVQLVGASTEEAVRAHLRGYDVSGEIALITTRRDGKPWFVLFWGDFTDRAAAERAVAALPSALKRVSPWIRPYADVHGELSAAGAGR